MGLKGRFQGAGKVLLFIWLLVMLSVSVCGNLSGCTIKIYKYIILQSESLKNAGNLKCLVILLTWFPPNTLRLSTFKVLLVICMSIPCVKRDVNKSQ